MASSKILICGENNAFNSQLCYLLEASGHAVITTPCGRDALGIAENQDPDIVVLECTLPNLSGIDVCRLLRRTKLNHDLPVIVMATHDRGTDPVLALEAGADDCIVKPFSLREMLARIHSILRRARMETSVPSTTFGNTRAAPHAC
jgi:DNA-binding response OmpR family regulator